MVDISAVDLSAVGNLTACKFSQREQVIGIGFPIFTRFGERAPQRSEYSATCKTQLTQVCQEDPATRVSIVREQMQLLDRSKAAIATIADC